MKSNSTEATTQRRLILIRHAKAVEEDVRGDHTRKLSERGQADAAALGKWLKDQDLRPGLVLCSTATRTRETLAAIINTIPVILSDKLYLASVGEMLSQIQATDDTVTDLMLIGHNPGIHGLLALLVGGYANEADADRMLLKFPTAACAVLTLPAMHWRDVLPESATLEQLRY